MDDKSAVESLERVMNSVKELSDGTFDIVFDLSLVRGQGYYTGTVFEVESIDFKGAIAGGGRYDNLIGKFLNEQVPAVGFSIGFERIFSILMQNGVQMPEQRKKVAVLYEAEHFLTAVRTAEQLRTEGLIASLYEKPKKTGKFLNKLEERGYDGFFIAGQSEELNWFGQA
jgi:histidyl-tRNA synthetase